MSSQNISVCLQQLWDSLFGTNRIFLFCYLFRTKYFKNLHKLYSYCRVEGINNWILPLPLPFTCADVCLIPLAASGFLQKEWTLCWTASVARTLGKASVCSSLWEFTSSMVGRQRRHTYVYLIWMCELLHCHCLSRHGRKIFNPQRKFCPHKDNFSDSFIKYNSKMSCKACQASNPLGSIYDVSVLIKLTQL